MQTTSVLVEHSLFPQWASLYLFYKNSIPDHRGKGWLLRFLHRIGVRKQKPFVWRMRNGVLLAISPTEGFAPWSVGWTCFEQGAWEPHIERTLRALVKPGSTVADIGANIGYFSAVMAKCVGSKGKVWAFEPVPSSFGRLALCKHLNRFDSLVTFPYALGAEEREVEIRYNPIIMGSASLYQESSAPEIQTAMVDMFRLDTLIARGDVTPPDLIKIDVEGHEMDVFRGAEAMIREAKPTIILEFNTETAGKAGWSFNDMVAMLKSFAPYRFYSLEGENVLDEIDPATFKLEYGKYVDILADAGRVDISANRQALSKKG